MRGNWRNPENQFRDVTNARKAKREGEMKYGVFGHLASDARKIYKTPSLTARTKNEAEEMVRQMERNNPGRKFTIKEL